jgi:hypothetical protein
MLLQVLPVVGTLQIHGEMLIAAVDARFPLRVRSSQASDATSKAQKSTAAKLIRLQNENQT